MVLTLLFVVAGVAVAALVVIQMVQKRRHEARQLDRRAQLEKLQRKWDASQAAARRSNDEAPTV